MPILKVGDRVRVVCSCANGVMDTRDGAEGRFGLYKVGDTGTVTHVGETPSSSIQVQPDLHCRRGISLRYLNMDPRELAPLTVHPVEMMLS